MKYQFEICANSVESCLAAQEGGAHRVELCAGIPEGGTTPSLGEIQTARRILQIKLHVIIRPRGGDFLYSPLEVEIMEEDIRIAKEAGADGIVIGCLTPDGEIDMPAMKRLRTAAGNCSVTFHRAFDRCKDPFKALDEIADLDIHRILTSGQQPTAPQGSALIKKLIEYANGRVSLMAGCGVNENNIRQLALESGATEFHFSAREKIESAMRYSNPEVKMGSDSINEYTREITTAQRVRRTIEALNNL